MISLRARIMSKNDSQTSGPGEIYPALGGDLPGNFVYSSLQSLASNLTGITVLLSGHWIPEEQPKFVIDLLIKFFAANSTKNK